MSTKKVSMPFGILGDKIREVSKTIPITDPDPWPVNDKLKNIGKRVN